MANEVVTLAYKARVGDGVGKAVLAALADQANADGVCWPSIAYIVERTEWDRRTVERWIRRLEAMGHISVIRSKGQNHLYHIHPRVDDHDPTPVTKSQVHKGSSQETVQGEKSDVSAPISSAAQSSPDAREMQPQSGAPNDRATDEEATCDSQSHVDNVLAGSGSAVTDSAGMRHKVAPTPVPESQGMRHKVARTISNHHSNPQLIGEGEHNNRIPRDQGRGKRVAEGELEPEESERSRREQLARIRAKGVAV